MRNLFVILDGVGYDQVTRFMPSGLAARGERTGLIPLQTLLAYSSGIYPSIWTGQYPNQHGMWTEFYRHETPKFALTSPLQVLPGKYLPRRVAYVVLAALKHLGLEFEAYGAVPPQLQSQFGRRRVRYEQLPPVDLSASLLITKLYEQLGHTWKYIHCDALNVSAEQQVLEAATRFETVILCCAELDHRGHILGPMAASFGEAFHLFDKRLERLLRAVEQKWPYVSIFMFSDHGMTPVIGQFDAWSYLEQAGFRLGIDYLAFIHSTLISLWFDDGKRDVIIAALNQSNYGRVLTLTECAHYHLAFQDQRYGDEFFLASEGIELIPNFISLAWKRESGMHGYDPACASTRAFFIGGEKIKYQPQDIVGMYNVLAETAQSPRLDANALMGQAL